MERDLNTVHKLTLQVLPELIICWKARCKCRFEGMKMSSSRIILKVTQQINIIAHKQFPNIPPYMIWIHFIDLMEKAKISTTIEAVKWLTPEAGWMELNTDGCSKGNPGECCGWHYQRRLRLRIAYAMPLGIETNNYAETMAMKTGVEWCMTNGVRNIEIECDSLLLVDWILTNNHTPRKLQDAINNIRDMTAGFLAASGWLILAAHRAEKSTA
ncbi:hypothetical protein KY289_031098 [Solanum tuberosum]|nr:hypothetical protein KY284_030771 [Solanum tuberosum]KAH0653420.1 hypothetical protein KY289_031098 [Solanum tuberosum]